jgi:AcrR family transcriptional regulator
MSAVNEKTAWPLRRAKAAETRRAVIDAASVLFVERGYAGASIQEIADVAGVSRATVFNAVGGKAALLKAAYDVATVGDDEPVPLPQRSDWVTARFEPDPRRFIALYAGLIATIGDRLAPIYEVFRAAANSDPDVNALWRSIQAERLGGARGFVGLLRDKGRLREDLDESAAGDVVWVLIDASLYHRLVIERHWTKAQFQSWLEHTLKAQLLVPETRQPHPGNKDRPRPPPG